MRFFNFHNRRLFRPSWIILFLLPLVLSACYVDRQERQLAKCQRETQPIGYPSDMRGFNADLMDACMQMAGYRFDVSHRECKQQLSIPLRVNAYCYVPADPVQAWLYYVERTLRGD
jgi:hypothetical protein